MVLLRNYYCLTTIDGRPVYVYLTFTVSVCVRRVIRANDICLLADDHYGHHEPFSYSFQYGVNDPHTKDVHNHREESDVKGSHSPI